MNYLVFLIKNNIAPKGMVYLTKDNVPSILLSLIKCLFLGTRLSINLLLYAAIESCSRYMGR